MNILIILADDLGYGDLGIYGNPDLKTPHFDRLARGGVRLSQHYSGSPICAPARATLLTGRYNHRMGALSVESNRGLDRINVREQTIADHFKSAGYATGMIGKWHNGLHDMRYHPNNRGFDEFLGFLNGGMHYWNSVIERNGQPVGIDERYLTDLFTDEAVNFIHRHAKDPFLLYLAYNAPHGPLEAPEEETQPYTEKYNAGVATLYGMISRMDKGIGRVLDTLDRCGLTDDTLVLFTSDNGPWLGNESCNGETFPMARYNGPFRGMKQDVLEGGIRVPAIARWPGGLPSGTEVHDMIHFCDWLPTVLAACGLPSRSDLPLDGVNILPALRGEGEYLPAKRFWQYNRYDPVPHCNATMRDGPWKLYWPRIPDAMQKLSSDTAPYYENLTIPHVLMDIENPTVKRTLSAPSPPELYHIDNDPGESRNLADRHPNRIAKMKTELETWFETVDAERRTLEDKDKRKHKD